MKDNREIYKQHLNEEDSVNNDVILAKDLVIHLVTQ